MGTRRASLPGLVLTLLAVLGLVAACTQTPAEQAAGARAWIDFPRDGATIPAGATVVVVSHANAADGVAEVLLSDNGTAYRRDPTTAPGETLVEFRQEWVPQEPGLHTLQVRAYTSAGAAGGTDTITVRVEGEAAPSTPTPTATPTPTTTPTATTTPTPTPSRTATPTPTTRPTPATTPTPTPPPATTQPPFTATPFPPDTTPPAVPQPMVPANGLVVECRTTQNLAWIPVTDPSGVTYDVRLERQITASTWDQVRALGLVSAKQVDVPVQCGVIYRWSVRARDGAGNFSAWSAWSGFSVDLG